MRKPNPASNKVIISSADPNWLSKFLVEKQRIQTTGESLNIAIEHIGSTSIPDLDAKPIIDILIATTNEAELKPTMKILTKLGYVLEGSRNNNQHSWLSYPSPNNREFIVHLVIKDDDEWRRRINFRDYMRSHPEIVKKYNDLKQDLVKKYPNNLDLYTHGKAAFVADVLRTASGIL